jgi:oxygen-dependent protoporphyrinogen oxidase
MRIAIVGAGIAGLSAAFQLEQRRRRGAPVEYAVFEASGRPGGVIRTERLQGFLVEAGPDSFLSEKRWAATLCRYLGLADDLLPSNDYQRKTFIVVRGRLVEIPDGLMFMVPTKLWPMATTRLFSLGAKIMAASELWTKPRQGAEDESVASFVTRHFGREMVDRMADPLLAGVYGGSADKLSVRAVLPRFVEMERTTGSLARALVAQRTPEARKKMPAESASSLFTTLRHGMQQMTDALVAKLAPGALRLNTPVWSLRRAGEKWTLVTDSGEQHFDAVILAVPAYQAADLLGSVAEGLANELRGVKYNSSITVALAYDAAALDAAARARMEGFGFLVPKAEGKQMLACTFVHNKFHHRAPEGKLLLRCFIGGEAAEADMQLSDEELSGAIRAELRAILGPALAAEPLFARVFRWRQAMAQYEVGHLERVARIEAAAAQLPGLALAGNAYHGIGVPDCVREGTQAAERLLLPPAK